MSCRVISPDELRNSLTLIRKFIVYPSDNERKFSDLVQLFKEAMKKVPPADDESRDFRTLDFIEILKNKKWLGPLFFVDNNLGTVQDGIHRGIAYLMCIEDGVPEQDLPRLIVCRK